jgi:hypothetical protein
MKSSIQNTPDFVYVPPQPLEMVPEKNMYDVYVAKFKTAIYGTLLFIVLSLPSAYKILDIIGKLFSNNIEIVDSEYGEPVPLGRAVMGLMVGILLFLL